MAGDEPVTSPDQMKPVNHKWARIGAIATIIALLLCLFPRHRSHVEDVFLIGGALTIAAILVGDWLLRKNGLKSD